MPVCDRRRIIVAFSGQSPRVAPRRRRNIDRMNVERLLRGAKFVRFWRLWPHTDSYSNPLVIAIYVLGFVPVLLLSLAFLARWGVPDFVRVAPLLAFAAYLTLVDMVFAASIRYRMPIEPFMIVLAATALARFGRRWASLRPLLDRLDASTASSPVANARTA
jgi:hypothetical protein